VFPLSVHFFVDIVSAEFKDHPNHSADGGFYGIFLYACKIKVCEEYGSSQKEIGGFAYLMSILHFGLHFKGY